MEMTVTQALEERKLLIKKIFYMTERAEFVGSGKGMEDNSVGRCMETAKWKKRAERAWKEILDSIQRYQKLDAAILASDAAAHIDTSFGRFTVAEGLSLKKRLDGYDFDGVELEFEENLFRKVRQEYREKIEKAEQKEALLVDPFNIMEKAEQLVERKDQLLTELTTQIQLSNANTWIQIE